MLETIGVGVTLSVSAALASRLSDGTIRPRCIQNKLARVAPTESSLCAVWQNTCNRHDGDFLIRYLASPSGPSVADQGSRRLPSRHVGG